MLLVYPVTKIKLLKVQKGFKNTHSKTLQKLHLYLNRRKDKDVFRTLSKIYDTVHNFRRKVRLGNKPKGRISK